MAAKVTFFQVGNGDMTLVRLADTRGTSILTDVHIRSAADNPNDDTPDVASALRSRLKYDEKDRPFIDVLCSAIPIRIIAVVCVNISGWAVLKITQMTT
ncbi:hypothetical protein [Klebsiella pneumoniae]|uniref:hypothetical protein n=1 Tax=Klebsiella pneumoniae TaxID=573 RepID=UPI00211C6839